MNWDSFVKGSLKALHSGSDIPNYFGCLIPVLTTTENTASQTESQIIEDEPSQISMQGNNEYEKYSQNSVEESEMEQMSKTRSLSAVHNLEPEEEETILEEEEHHEEEVLSDIPKEEVQSFDSPIKPARQSLGPKTPEQYSDSDTMMQEHNISLIDLDDHAVYPKEEKKSLAEEFRKLGDSIMDRYWGDIDGLEVPRLSRESKVMVTFRVSKFVKLQKAMTERFNAVRAEGKNGVITFKRVE